jgi:predicted nucleic acid-binding protein
VLYLLDTNVLSELARPRPDPIVVDWMTARRPATLSISVLTLGEIARGIALRADDARRSRLVAWAATIPLAFAGRLYPVTDAIALAWGELDGSARRSGRPLGAVDGLLLATAKVHALTLVTRNTADFARRGVAIENPWD